MAAILGRQPTFTTFSPRSAGAPKRFPALAEDVAVDAVRRVVLVVSDLLHDVGTLSVTSRRIEIEA